MTDFIKVRGARVHNLKNINVDIPINKITCVAGPSGSGKTSLVFHTLFTESKRRYVNSFPTSLKFFLDRPTPVDVDLIEPVLPAFALPQLNPVAGSRTNVADISGLTEKLQNFFCKEGHPVCPVHGLEYKVISPLDQLKTLLPDNLAEDEIIHILLHRDDYLRFYSHLPFPSRSWNTQTKELHEYQENDDAFEMLRIRFRNIDEINRKMKFEDHLRYEIFLAKANRILSFPISLHPACPHPGCQHKWDHHLNVNHFAPYSPAGACHHCKGYGSILVFDRDKLIPNDTLSIDKGCVKFIHHKALKKFLKTVKEQFKKNDLDTSAPFKDLPAKKWDVLFTSLKGAFSYLDRKQYRQDIRIYRRSYQSEIPCIHCEQTRLIKDVHHVTIEGKTYKEFLCGNLAQALQFIKSLPFPLPREFASIKATLTVSVAIGLGHLPLTAKAKDISSSEYQRLLLVKYLSFVGQDSLFIFDEVSLGLDERELEFVFVALSKLKEQGNTVILIDHAPFFHERADHFILMGPGAGHLGGEIIYQGTYKKEAVPAKNKNEELAKIKKASNFITIKEPDIKIPIGELSWVHGPSGGGKSKYMLDLLAEHLHYNKFGTHISDKKIEYKSIDLPKNFSYEDVIIISAARARGNFRSSVGGITDLLTPLRQHFLKLPVSKYLDLKTGHFSSNSALGRCASCEGKGEKVIEMMYLEDVILPCEECKGMKINPYYANISDGRFSYYEATTRPLGDVLPHLKLTPKFLRIFEFMQRLNLDYLGLDRSVNSLSGGEMQRILLLSRLQNDIKNSFLFFENLSFGLSHIELEKIASFLIHLTGKGNTIIVIDENPLWKNQASNEIHCI